MTEDDMFQVLTVAWIWDIMIRKPLAISMIHLHKDIFHIDTERSLDRHKGILHNWIDYLNIELLLNSFVQYLDQYKGNPHNDVDHLNDLDLLTSWNIEPLLNSFPEFEAKYDSMPFKSCCSVFLYKNLNNI